MDEDAHWFVKTSDTSHLKFSDVNAELDKQVPLGLIFDGYGEDAEVTVFDMNTDFDAQFVYGTGWFAADSDGTVGT